MIVTVNGEKETIENSSLTVSELLTIKKVEMPDMVSEQLNGEFVDRDTYSALQVNDGDEVEFLYFMGGGSR